MASSTHTIAPAEALWPRRLAELPAAPTRLFVRGDAGVLGANRVVAMVGARAATGHGLARARELAAELAGQGVVVVSGGAIGIDAGAHLGALTADAPTVAVLATGLDAPYPARHRPLFDRIVAGGGALVTSFEPGVPLRRWHFPRRNEIIAALADAVVVVEAEDASGSLYTAKAARSLGRPVLAAPGSRGADALLAAGAAIADRAADVLAALAGEARYLEAVAPEPGSDQAKVLEALDVEPLGPDAVAARAGLAAPAALRALCGLELEGLALRVPGGHWIRSTLAARAACT